MKKGNALFYQPGQEPKLVEIDGTLENLKELVEGWIDFVRLPKFKPNMPEFNVIVNDEGLLLNKPLNRGELVGNLVVVAVDEEVEGEWRGLKEEELGLAIRMMDMFLPEPEDPAPYPSAETEFISFNKEDLN